MITRMLIIAGVVLVVGPVALSPFYDLPPLVFAVPPAVLGLATAILFSLLDTPRAPRPPPRRRQPPRPPAPRPHDPGVHPRRKQRARVLV